MRSSTSRSYETSNFSWERVRKRGEEKFGVVTASPEAGSCAKIDVTFFGWFWFIVESGNILRLLRPLLPNSFAAEVKKEPREGLECESFYLLLLFFYLFLFFLSALLF